MVYKNGIKKIIYSLYFVVIISLKKSPSKKEPKIIKTIVKISPKKVNKTFWKVKKLLINKKIPQFSIKKT
ncbi:MAG: hypothetical protein EAZ20_01750 [Bacteroidetes bacterium]|nr:MAG: hypothetical protein EAZ20_01750 [Bacteroidota bacterium]